MHASGAHTFAPPGGDAVPRSGVLPDPTAAGEADRHAPARTPAWDDLQPAVWDGPGGVSIDSAVAVLQQELSAAMPGVAVAA